MELRRVPIAEWRQMTEAEQRAVIRSGMVGVEELPDDFRLLIDEMLLSAAPQRRSA